MQQRSAEETIIADITSADKEPPSNMTNTIGNMTNTVGDVIDLTTTANTTTSCGKECKKMSTAVIKLLLQELKQDQNAVVQKVKDELGLARNLEASILRTIETQRLSTNKTITRLTGRLLRT